MRRGIYIGAIALYSAYFGYLVLSGRLTDLVNPRMRPFVIFGAVVLALFAGAELFLVPSRRSRTLPSGVALVVLPLLLIPLTGGNGGFLLSSFAPQNPPTLAADVALSAPASMPAPAPAPARTAAANTSPPVPSGSSLTLTEKNYFSLYTKLYARPASFRGDTIEITGRIIRDGTSAGNQLLAAHLLMWCCAADAVPAGFLCSGPMMAGTQLDGWVRIRGTLSTTKWADPYSGVTATVPLVNVSSVHRLASADFVYVYP